MGQQKHNSVTCQICKAQKNIKEVSPADTIRLSMVTLIKEKYPDFDNSGFICKTDLNEYRALYVERLFDKEKGELSEVEKQVIENIKDQEIITKNLYEQYDKELTFWEKMADNIARFGGSWRFIGFFMAVMVLWIGSNVILVHFNKSWDPFPFIFLNLILSCVAAIQAPVIMMSQNRVEQRDRLRSESEYQINLKAEIGIRNLHEKMDHLLFKQWEKMTEIQNIQLEFMRELTEKKNNSKMPPGGKKKTGGK